MLRFTNPHFEKRDNDIITESSIEVFLVTVDFIILRMKSTTHFVQGKRVQDIDKCENFHIFRDI